MLKPSLKLGTSHIWYANYKMLALYGLKQAPRAWYERLHKYLVKIGFERTDENNCLSIKTKKGKDILISKIFVDDIIFGRKDSLCKDFAHQMEHEFEMSMIGEIKLFVGLQVYQLKYDIEDSKLVSTPMIIGYKLSKNDE